MRTRGSRLKRGFRVLIAPLIVSSLVVGAFGGVLMADAKPKPNYPSWSDVNNAKKSVAKKKAMIAKLHQVIVSLTVQQLALEKVAMAKAEKYNQAKNIEDAMRAKVKVLAKKAKLAAAQADQANTQLGEIASQMYRNGTLGTSMNLFLNASNAGNLLYKLGTQEQLAGQANTIYKRAIQRQNYANAIKAQLVVATKELAVKTAAAEDALAQAQAAADALTAKVNEQKALNLTFTSQLASLEHTAASLEQQRIQGLIEEARQQNGTGPIDEPSLYNVGPPDKAKVEKMIAYASQQLGKPYVLGGMGPRVWDCSGITKAAYASVGIYIGTHSATNQFRTLAQERKLVPLRDAQRGDLMWYTFTQNQFDGDKYHVVIYLGKSSDGTDMILEAANPLRPVRIHYLYHGDLFGYAGRPTA